MTLLQLMAASLARIDRLVFHTINPSGNAGFEEARSLFDGDIAGDEEPIAMDELLDRVVAMGFHWRVSNGT